MSDATQPYDPIAESPIAESRAQFIAPPQSQYQGCLYGCLFVVGAAIALTVCAGIGGYWLLSGQVEKYTSATPAELPSVDYTDEQFEALEARVDAFAEAVEQGETPAEDLELSAEELNALISQDEDMKGRVFIRIEDGQVSGDISIPTDPLPGGNGRFFNGSATLDVSMEAGVLIVTLADAEVNGEALPQQFVDAMANENLAKEAYKNAETAEVLRRFEEISVSGDKILLKMRREESNADDSLEPEPQTLDSPDEALKMKRNTENSFATER
jgi:hypothetical protein